MTKNEIVLSPKQFKIATLYRKVHGKNIFWVKKGKIRVLDPEEIIIA